ncbi:MAG TPA: DUF2752 domain-containing protein [Candidatus Dormibacteraeota bacterium]|nr:DUF2752 domain-containing protein [Candidatus Dormibacteraeota bacterium]
MRVLPIGMTRAVTAERMRDLAVAAALVLWLVYTRIYWLMQAAHLGAPPCPFYYWTGHPCPFCGGTRSFAYMWRGDISDAVRLYPFGPVLFAGTIVTVGTLVGGAITGRTWVPRLSRAQWQGVGVGALVALLISWALKVFVLGN